MVMKLRNFPDDGWKVRVEGKAGLLQRRCRLSATKGLGLQDAAAQGSTPILGVFSGILPGK